MQSVRVGLIGVGHIGSALARLWTASHPLLLSSRHPESLRDFARELGHTVQVGTPEDASVFGAVVLLSIPLGEVAKLSGQIAERLVGRVVLDTSNPYPQRDGDAALEAIRSGRGSGMWTADQLPGAHVVKAFNTIPAQQLAELAFRPGERIGVPLAGDDRDALETAARLVLDAGFDPVLVGGLTSSREFDVGSSVYGQALTARELRVRLEASRAGAMPHNI